MEQYFPVISRSSNTYRSEQGRRKTRESAKYRPYIANRPPPKLEEDIYGDELPVSQRSTKREDPATVDKAETSTAIECDKKMSSASMSRLVIGTLRDGINPITNSDIFKRTDFVNSTSTGHQVGDVNRGNGYYMRLRERKLSTQRKATEDENVEELQPQVMKFVRVYIDGYLEDTTDIEMKRVVTNAGGQITGSPSGCTHIVTSMLLNGSKTQKFLATRKNKIHVVKPEWVFDSIETGKRKPERAYAIVRTRSAETMSMMLNQI